MKRVIALLIPLLLLGLCHPVSAQTPARAFQDVPQVHWSYDAVQQIAQRGLFTGYPDGTFSGKKALTRYEFAVAIQRLVQEAVRDRETEGNGMMSNDVIALQKLVQEFTEELVLLGANVEAAKRQLRSFREPWKAEPPDLATASAASYPGVGIPEDPGYQVGVRLAASAWMRGEVAFLVSAFAKRERFSRSTGIPYRVLGQQQDDPYVLSIIAGHNAEIRNRIRQFGPPKRVRGSEPPVQISVELSAPYGKTRMMQVSLDQPEACSRDGRVLLRLEENGPRRDVMLRITLPDRTFLVPFLQLRDRHQILNGVVDPTNPQLLRVVTRANPGDGPNQFVQWRVDLATGEFSKDGSTGPNVPQR